MNNNQSFHHRPQGRSSGGQSYERQDDSSILPSAAMNLLQSLNGEQKKNLFDALSLFLAEHQQPQPQQRPDAVELPRSVNYEVAFRGQVESRTAASASSANHDAHPSILGQSTTSNAVGTQFGNVDPRNVATSVSQLLAQELVRGQVGQGGGQINRNLDLLRVLQNLASNGGPSQFNPQSGMMGQGQGGLSVATTANTGAIMQGNNNNVFSTVSAGTLTAAAAAAAAAASERSKQEASSFNVPSAFTTTTDVRAQFSSEQNGAMALGVEHQKKQAATELKTASASYSAVVVPTPKALSNSAYLTAGKSAADADSLDDPIKNKMIISCPARKMPWDHNQYTAYFRILPETKHGDELICSYVSCCERGSKFLYCKFCHAAVSKRHFFAKHCHAGEPEPKNEHVEAVRMEQDKSSNVAVATENNHDEAASHLSEQEPYYELTTSRSVNEAAFSSLSGSGTGSSQQVSETHGDATVPSSNLACADQTHDKGTMSSLSSYGNGQNSAQQDQVSMMSSVSSCNEAEFKDGHVVDKLPEDDQKDGSDSASDKSSTRAVKYPLSKRATRKKRPLSESASGDHPISSSTAASATKKSVRAAGKEHLAGWSRLYNHPPKFDDKGKVTGWFIDLLDTSVPANVSSRGPKRAKKSKEMVEQASRAVKFMKNLDGGKGRSATDNRKNNEWNVLLECRPPLDNNDAVTKWLEQILNTSASGNNNGIPAENIVNK